jgi:hypothetical protein
VAGLQAKHAALAVQIAEHEESEESFAEASTVAISSTGTGVVEMVDVVAINDVGDDGDVVMMAPETVT